MAAVVERDGRVQAAVRRRGRGARVRAHADPRARRRVHDLELELLRQVGRVDAGPREHVEQLPRRAGRDHHRPRSAELRQPGKGAARIEPRDAVAVDDEAAGEHEPGRADRQPLGATDERAVDREPLVARRVDDLQTERPRRPLVPAERYELLAGRRLDAQERAARLRDERQPALDERRRQAERRPGELAHVADRVGIARAEQQRHDLAISRIRQLAEVGAADRSRLGPSPLAVLLPLPRLQIERERVARDRGGAVDHVDDLRIREARRRGRRLRFRQVARELREELLPRTGAPRCVQPGAPRDVGRCRVLRIGRLATIDRHQRRGAGKRAVAEEITAALRLEEGRPDVLADDEAIVEVRTVAGRGERAARVAMNVDDVGPGPADDRVGGPRCAVDLLHGAIEVIRASLDPAAPGHLACQDARQRLIARSGQGRYVPR